MGLGVHLNYRVTHINERSCSSKQAIYPDPDEQVRLSVGGKIFSARIADLTRISGTMLERMADQIWKRFSGPEPVFIDRDHKYFELILDYLTSNDVDLPHTEAELAAIVQEAEFYQIDELIAKIVREDRRCFGEGPPFFPKDRRGISGVHCPKEAGLLMEAVERFPYVSLTSLVIFSPNEVCYLCGVETKDFHGLYKSLFDFSRDFSYVIGEIEKVYGDCCCCDVRFGKSSFVFHIPTKMLCLAH